MKRFWWIVLLFLVPRAHAQGTQIASYATDPPTCNSSRGLLEYNTTTLLLKVCGPTPNSWSVLSGGGGGIGGAITPNHLTYASGSNTASDVLNSAVTPGTGAILLNAGTTTPFTIQNNGSPCALTPVALFLVCGPGIGTSALSRPIVGPLSITTSDTDIAGIMADTRATGNTGSTLATFCGDEWINASVAWAKICALSGSVKADIAMALSNTNPQFSVDVAGTSGAHFDVSGNGTINMGNPAHIIFGAGGAPTIQIGVDNVASGALILSNGNANAHTQIGSNATTTQSYLLPTVVGSAGQFLTMGGGASPQQLSWTGAVTVLDCSTFAGADMGAKINACIAALPAAGGVADATKFTSPQTLTTAVVVNKPAALRLCGIAISQQANISLTVANASLDGCQSASTIITKAANIDQVTISGALDAMTYITLVGVSGSFTGNGVTISAAQDYVANNTISGEATAGINLAAGANYDWILNNELSGFILHAIQGGFDYYLSHNDIQDTATATGTTIEAASEINVSENAITNTHGFAAIHNTNTTTNNSYYTGNVFQSNGTVLSLNGFDVIHHNLFYATGANPAISGGQTIDGNLINMTASASDAINNLTHQFAKVVNNNIQWSLSGAGGGFCAVNLNSVAGNIGSIVSGNEIYMQGSATTATYGICITTVAATASNQNIIADNSLHANVGGAAGSTALRFNNTAGITTAGSQNIFKNNKCDGFGSCISRVDAQNLKNTYENNSSISIPIFVAGGSTNDIVLDDVSAFTFATLPTAGDGSRIFCTDCTSATPTAGGGTGTEIVHIAGAWSGLPSSTSTRLICSGQIALTTGAIASGTRATNTLSCTGLATATDSISCTFNSDTNAVTGYAPSASGGLTLKTWASANTINVDQVNNTSGSITPGAATVNCKGLR